MPKKGSQALVFRYNSRFRKKAPTEFCRGALIYNTRTVELIDEVAVGMAGPQANARQTLRYQLRPVSYDSSADFYIYNSDFASGDDQRQLVEAMANRADADALGDDAHIIFLGDLNVQSDNALAYKALLSAGPGQAIDPIDRPGTWTDAIRFRDVHTHATTDSSNRDDDADRCIRGVVRRGMDDRFDFQLVTAELLDGEGLSYLEPDVPNLHVPPVEASYRAFGNNGTHLLNGDISSGTGASPDVLSALEKASDHLPVVVDYQLPARMSVEVEPTPAIVAVGSGIAVNFVVENSAPVETIIGADELDYRAFGTGSVVGSVTAIETPLGDGNRHSFALDTTAVGHSTGTLEVVSTSQQVTDGTFVRTISYDVLQPDDSNADFEFNQQEGFTASWT